jgi:hypothetical protein
MRKRCGYCIHFQPSDHELVRNRGYDGICAKLMFTKMRVSAGCDHFVQEGGESFAPGAVKGLPTAPPKQRVPLH